MCVKKITLGGSSGVSAPGSSSSSSAARNWMAQRGAHGDWPGAARNAPRAGCARHRLGARRTLPAPRRSAACRSLFGPVDHADLAQELRCQLREMREECSRRWDYDFQRDAPLRAAGRRYTWEETGGDTVPAFYREAGSLRCRLSQGNPTQEVADPGHPPGLGNSRCGGSQQGDTLRAGLPAPGGCVSVRRSLGDCHRITDFLPVRKKTKEAKALCDKTSSEPAVPAEQAPRKRLR